TLNGSPAGTAAAEAGFYATSGASAALAAGNYFYDASYAGDPNYNDILAGKVLDENFVVDPAHLTISTVVHDGSHNEITGGMVPLGTSAHDNAMVTGAVAGFPIPAISFTFGGNPIANGATEAGFDATSVPTGPLGAGNYMFGASVGSNSNYVGAASDP